LQIVQQFVGPDGQIQQIPIQLSANQLQMLRMQLQSTPTATSAQVSAPPTPIQIIQTAPTIQQATSPPTSVMTTTTSQNGTQIIQTSS